ncbi:MAG TPA: tRNA (adenosine(37)-N6)-threonylcarbamoyltransferase complex dimerization subunit type 1 TsaB [Candidatus Angelobacter sp.]|nr:tRNA (adenosine(37)-N6)-threonylcarbamoyltransferase complex dimerization subunit type 1 TsaB [Candidatus Angelobacter sp.]
MLVLAIDTSGKSGGITLAEGDTQSFRAIESCAIPGGTFSAQLVPELAALLGKHGFQPRDIGGFVAVSGPGSFTGLRVGLSAIKGFAEALQKPVAVVSLLEALAILSAKEGRIAAALDAGRNEVFFGVYDVQDGRAVTLKEVLLSQAGFLEEAKMGGLISLVTSDALVAQYASAAGIDILEIERPTSESIARMGLKKLFAGETVSAETLDANYMRRSDPEIFLKSKQVS